MSLAIIIILAGIGLVIILAFIVCFSWFFARMWCRPKRIIPTENPDDYNLPFESITFISQGILLNGWFIPVKNRKTSSATILLVHGWSHNGAQMLPVARHLHEAGFGVFLFHTRGHGTSADDGPITIRKFAEDIIDAINHLQRRADVDVKRIGVLGHSMGGSSAILASSMDARIRALISSSAFADPYALTRDYMKSLHIPRWLFLKPVCYFIEGWLGTSIKKVTPKNCVSQIKVPLLLIHGEADRFLSPSNIEVLFSSSNQKFTSSWLAPNRRHSDVILNPNYGEQVIRFFAKYL